MIDILILFIVGFIFGLGIDLMWWHTNIKKLEKGFEALEHYHFGILSLIIGVLIANPIPLGLGLALILKESDQAHPFAYLSEHFRKSSYIGIAMFILLAAVILI